MVCGGFRFVRFFVLSESMVEQMPRNLSEPPSCLRWHPMLCAAGTSRWPTTRSKASCRSCRPSSSAAPTSGGSASSATRRAPGCRPPPPRQCTRARPPHLPHLPVHSSVWLEAFLSNWNFCDAFFSMIIFGLLLHHSGSILPLLYIFNTALFLNALLDLNTKSRFA